MCIFLTNVLQKLRKRISAKLLDGGTRHGHNLSQPAYNVKKPSARQRSAIQKRKKGRRGECVCVWGGGGDRLESPVETHSSLWVFSHVLLLFLYGFGGGGKLLI